MIVVADLHIHSRFSRSCSKQINFRNLSYWSNIKGINLLGTGDFTHAQWLKEFEEEVIDSKNGFYKLKDDKNSVNFVLSSEISCIYKQNDKTRRVHIVILMPSIASVKKFNKELIDRGCNLKSDGRPIIGLSAEILAGIALDVDKKSLIIPAHIWTPWFSALGSKSGFDSIEECFGKYSKNIYALETGLSSDPKMNWFVSSLDNYVLVSNSDSHSLERIGREANVFDFENFNYDELYNILKNKDKKKFLYTIEFYPEEGKYHFDGHRICNVSIDPLKFNKVKICSVCKKQLTPGVLRRVEELSDRTEKEVEKIKNKFINYKNCVGLKEIIGEAINQRCVGKKVNTIYFEIIKNFASEFDILLNKTELELKTSIKNPTIVEAIMRMRKGEINVIPGFDGEYGIVKIFSDKEKIKNKELQQKLF
ncbi:MAG: endonuclease Q family protein [Patescibacteria group bacterium]|nr:endonuclease Q family protein [Patescibacteria group bacterium]